MWLAVTLLSLPALTGATLGVFGALFHPLFGVAVLALLAAITRRQPKGRKLIPFLAWTTGLGLLLCLTPYFLPTEYPCPSSDTTLRWVARGNATYDAVPLGKDTFAMGRREFVGTSGLLITSPKITKPVGDAQAVQSLTLWHGNLAAADWGTGELLVLSGKKRNAVPLCRWPIQMAHWHGDLLVLCEGDRRLALVTGPPTRVKRFFPVRPDLAAPYGLAVDDETDTAYITNWNPAGGMEVLNLRTGHSRFIHTGGPAMGVVLLPERGEVWVAQPLHRRILRLDSGTLREKDRLPSDLGTRRLAVTENAVGAVNYFAGTFQAWDRKTLAPLARLPVGKLARGIQPFGKDRFVVSTGCGVGVVDYGTL